MALINMEVIDQLKELQSSLNNGLLDKLVKLYVDDVPKVVAELSQFAADGQYEELAKKAHAMKSSSGNLGIVLFQDICGELETHIVNSESVEKSLIDKNIKVLQDNLPSVIQQLEFAASSSAL